MDSQTSQEGASGSAFVIHKHAARRLHYDMRLEIDGVLASWALPKGPSLDPADKRLAVRVDDHALAYGTFEGVIPEGQYGAGAVIVWDRGIWRPVVASGTSVQSQLARGSLTFTLAGEKLRGAWTLVRMKQRPDAQDENWLLIKGRDEYARPRDEWDVVVAMPESVETGRLIESVASAGNE